MSSSNAVFYADLWKPALRNESGNLLRDRVLSSVSWEDLSKGSCAYSLCFNAFVLKLFIGS